MYDGFYINLKTSTKRNQELRKHLKSLNLLKKYTRIEGINGREEYPNYNNIKINAGSLGCSLSHMKVIQENLDSPRHLHILEDDAILHQSITQGFAGVCDKMEWDLIFTDAYFPILSFHNFHKLNEAVKKYKENKSVSLINLYSLPFNGMTSYFVNKNSIKKLHRVFRQDTFQEKTDCIINKLVQEKKLTAWAFVPFITTISSQSTDSNINETYNSNLLAMDILREAFYIDADLERLRQKATSYKQGLNISPLVRIYSDTTEILLDNLDSSGKCGGALPLRGHT